MPVALCDAPPVSALGACVVRGICYNLCAGLSLFSIMLIDTLCGTRTLLDMAGHPSVYFPI